jgi:cellulose synthase/poly-beta-1,6-N-acetylglucosamine synthase-like glycosyltransferase
VVDASSRRGTSHARNVGAQAARGDLLLYCDGDDVVMPSWIGALVDAAAEADVVAGRLRWDALNDAVTQDAHAVRDVRGLEPAHGFLSTAPGGNMAVWAQVARDVCWDEGFRYGSSDEAFGWRLQLAGYRLAFARDAVVQQRLRGTLGEVVRQQFRFGLSGPTLIRAFREHPVPRPDNRAAVRRWWWLATHVHHLWRSASLRRQWIRRATFRLGRLAGSLRERTLCL